ncbi:MAG: hypothetical protein NT133_06670 [Alphaproteobacteria bacterium]|nr:hypothetical protein [Alphaproteobacteria bacterium]
MGEPIEQRADEPLGGHRARVSIIYDVVTKQHGGTITVDSAPGVFTEFTVTLPRTTRGTAA